MNYTEIRLMHMLMHSSLRYSLLLNAKYMNNDRIARCVAAAALTLLYPPIESAMN